jgi:hypothetical protein
MRRISTGGGLDTLRFIRRIIVLGVSLLAVLFSAVPSFSQATVSNKRQVSASKTPNPDPTPSQLAAAKKLADQRMVGKSWSVVFANGQKDTWTMFHKADDKGVPMYFRDSSGQEMQITCAHGSVNIVTKQSCIITGHIIKGNVRGQVLYGCPQPHGTRFTASVTP